MPTIALNTADNKYRIAAIFFSRYAGLVNVANATANVTPNGEHVRERILTAAARLIAAGGQDAATTRAVAAAAAVQAPTIYRLFGDKRGLLDAVAEYSLAAYIAEKSAREPHPDPVQDLRDGWDLHVAFGLSHPDLFAILSGGPHQNSPLPVVESGLEVLRRRVRRIALTGRLRVSEQRAVALLHSMCVGMVLSLLREPPERRDIVTCVAAREAVLAAITGEGTSARGSGPSAAAAELRASLGQTTVLTDGERHLLEELLDRVADGE